MSKTIMHRVGLSAAIALTAGLQGCAVLESPMSWGSPVVSVSSATQLRVDIDQIDSLNKFSEVSTRTVVDLAKQREELTKTIDRTSGGNYLWGLSLAAASLSGVHVSALKGIAFMGGTHVALSTRLAPIQQLTIVDDASNQLSCLREIADQQCTLAKGANSANTTLNSYQTLAGCSMNLAGLAVASGSGCDYAAKDDDLRKLKAAMVKVIVGAQQKLAGLYSQTAPSKIAGDLIQKSKDAMTAIQQNALQADAKTKAYELVVNPTCAQVAAIDPRTFKLALATQVESEKALKDGSGTLDARIAACVP